MALIAFRQIRTCVRATIGDPTLIGHLIFLLCLLPRLRTPLLTLIAVGRRWRCCERVNRTPVRIDTGSQQDNGKQKKQAHEMKEALELGENSRSINPRFRTSSAKAIQELKPPFHLVASCETTLALDLHKKEGGPETALLGMDFDEKRLQLDLLNPNHVLSLFLHVLVITSPHFKISRVRFDPYDLTLQLFANSG